MDPERVFIKNFKRDNSVSSPQKCYLKYNRDVITK